MIFNATTADIIRITAPTGEVTVARGDFWVAWREAAIKATDARRVQLAAAAMRSFELAVNSGVASDIDLSAAAGVCVKFADAVGAELDK
jgi:hypothetical protein